MVRLFISIALLQAYDNVPCAWNSALWLATAEQNSDQEVGSMALAKLAHDKAEAAGLGI